MYQAGLVLEGGGMKGVYTAGVLDLFLDKGIKISSCYGVSAGACSMCSYVSGQRGRGYHVSVDYLDNREYCSMYSLLRTGDLFGAQMCYYKIPDELNPYDHETFKQYKGTCYSVVTNIQTGLPEYIPIKDMQKDIEAIRASASLPLVSRNVKYNQNLYLDGGLSDPIPIRQSIASGNAKNIVIMTKEAGYRRKPDSMLSLIKVRYRKYPKIYELMKERHNSYNATLDYLEEQQKAGRVFLIQPKCASEVGRIEKDKEKLKALYEEGHRDAHECYEEMIHYLES